MYQPQPSGTRWLMGLFLGMTICSCVLIYWGLSSESIRRRVEAVPLYARAYLNKLRPTPVIPAPPTVVARAPETLLQTLAAGKETPSETSNTPPLFNDASLNAGQDRPVTDPNAVVLVESGTLSAQPAASQVLLSGVKHQWQTWNNCGPVTITMGLSYYGRPETQTDSAPFLKPNKDDKNVNPHELANYARTLGYEAIVRVGGSIDLLKQLLSNGMPVIVETWLDPEDNGGLGHYRLFIGYDEAGGYFIAEDSLHGSGVKVPFAEFDAFWQVFNRKYLVVYPHDKTLLLHSILGRAMLDKDMLEAALNTALAEAQMNPSNPYPWFNIGTNYARLGRPELAASAFDEARRIGLPYRMLWYQFDLFESYLHVGRYQEVVDLSSAILQATGGLEELYYYRGLAQQALGQIQPALEDFRAALNYNTNFTPAANALTLLGAS